MKIAIVGKIASGKSTLINELSKLGHSTLSVDSVVNDLYKVNNEGYKRIESFFGPEFVNGKEVDRKKLSKHVVTDKVNLEVLNGLIHPLIQDTIKKSNATFIELPILKSRYISYNFNKVVLLECPNNISIERLIKYRNFSNEKAINYINMWQEPDKEKVDLIIETRNNLTNLDIEKVVKLL
ncbi:MAG: dephospho-CoA kinase [Mycoplasmataceae bacterium]|nr:dephospho-CoA kinase [Mycoplasmataceae bacterium]